MINVTIYNKTTGEIFGLLTKNTGQNIDLRQDQSYVDGFYDHDEYFIDINNEPNEPKIKFTFNITINKTTISADNVDAYIISDIPVGSNCIIKSNNVHISENIDDGEIIFSTNNTGIYTVTLSHPHYVDLINTIKVI